MISAIILAAGASKRMGHPKMLLPWGNETVLTHVLSVFQNAEVKDIIVVTGGASEQINELISSFNVRTVYNEEYAETEMLSSIQPGIRALTPQTRAVLIGLGDQPQVQEGTVRKVCEAFLKSQSDLVVPSHRMRRGHPWLVARPLWNEILEMQPPKSLRDFLNNHAQEIEYVTTDNPSILQDLDTPEDYLKFKP